MPKRPLKDDWKPYRDANHVLLGEHGLDAITETNCLIPLFDRRLDSQETPPLEWTW